MGLRLSRAEMDDDYRISDREREAATLRLRADHLEGRLTIDELEERLAGVHAARMVSELRALQADLPERRYVPPPSARDGLPRWPGRRSFNERIIVPTAYETAYEHALAFLVPALESHRFFLRQEEDGVLVFEGPANDDRVTVRLRRAPDGRTLLIAHGLAGLRVRRAMASLRS